MLWQRADGAMKERQNRGRRRGTFQHHSPRVRFREENLFDKFAGISSGEAADLYDKSVLVVSRWCYNLGVHVFSNIVKHTQKLLSRSLGLLT